MPSSTDGARIAGPLAGLALALVAAGLLLAAVDGAGGEVLVLAVALVVGLAAIALTMRAAREARGRARADRDAELFEFVMEALDAEREALAQQLHDGPLQVVAAMRLMVDAAHHAIAEGDGERAAETLAKLQGYAAGVARDLRRTTDRLFPVVMEQRGLVPALGALAEMTTEEYGTPVIFSQRAQDWPSSPARDTALYQIAREATVGAARSGASGVRIVLDRVNGSAVLTVEADDATPMAETQHGQLRVELVAERAQRVGGRVRIEGTTVTVEVPS
jgi:signal transduction histidine kinase